jgi:hypothetical protein
LDALWSHFIAPLLREVAPAEICVSDPGGPLSARVRAGPRPRRSQAVTRLAVIDGDPNWYSVHRALNRLAVEERCPVVLVDDVGWPYAWRDGYVAPESIPSEHRNACRRQGVLPYRSDLAESGGVHAGRCNGVFSYGSHNGVAAAIADFVSAHPAVRYTLVPGFQPLGLVTRMENARGLLAEVMEDPNRSLARRGFFQAAAAARRAAAAALIHRAQQRIVAPAVEVPAVELSLAPPEQSGDSLRDDLRAALTGHPLLAQLLRCVDHVFRAAGIPYAVAEGTLLGALRHGGFIPHDDDVDIVVRREDVPRLMELAKGIGWIAGEGSTWAEIGRIAFICANEPAITDSGLWHRMPVVDIFPVSATSKSPILSAAELADCEHRPFCDFTVSVPRAAAAVLARRYGPRALEQVSVWRRGVAAPQALLGLREYRQICAEEGYLAPRTLAPVA